MSARRGAARMLLAAVVATLPGCAWANRDNRPVWNAFEARAVPEDTGWFVVTLPLTVPAGLAAIVLDTFVVHPARVVDDAWGDARDLWRGIQWREHYYTESAAFPLRVIATPVYFGGAFLMRSTFDVDPYEPPPTEAELRERAAAAEARSAAAWSAWFTSQAAGKERAAPDLPAPRWSPELERAFRDACRTAPAPQRAALYAAARGASLPPFEAEPWLGLEDPDAVVRYLVLVALPARVVVPEAQRRALLGDPNEMVKRLAEQRWPDSE